MYLRAASATSRRGCSGARSYATTRTQAPDRQRISKSRIRHLAIRFPYWYTHYSTATVEGVRCEGGTGSGTHITVQPLLREYGAREEQGLVHTLQYGAREGRWHAKDARTLLVRLYTNLHTLHLVRHSIQVTEYGGVA